MKTILLYSIFTVIASLIGVAIPYFLKINKSLVKLLMGLSSGIILGICIFHLIPETYESIGNLSVSMILIGFFIPIMLERFSKKDDFKSHTHGNLPLFNTITLIAFSIHSFIDGLLLINEHTSPEIGFTVFIGIISHKIPVSFSLMTILKTHISDRKKIIAYISCFIFMTPIGAIIGMLFITEMTTAIAFQLTSVTSGVFLYISLIHLYYDHKLYKHLNSNLIFALGVFISAILFSFGMH